MKFLIMVLLGVALMPLSANAVEQYDPRGLWLTANERSVIKVEECGDALCGRIAWIIEGGMQYDAKNPEERLRGQPMCGLMIVQNLKQSGDGFNRWDQGKIYKADDGDIYDASLKITSANKLTVRGFRGISILGKSQEWTRVDAAQYPACKAP